MAEVALPVAVYLAGNWEQILPCSMSLRAVRRRKSMGIGT